MILVRRVRLSAHSIPLVSLNIIKLTAGRSVCSSASTCSPEHISVGSAILIIKHNIQMASAAKPTGPLPRVLFVLGGPGAGKGTQCSRLVADYGYVHLSAGDLLRAEREAGGPVGDMINEYIREGKIVPVEVTVNLLRKAMIASKSSRFLVDGFPRNANNLEGWQSVMGAEAIVDAVLVYDCPESVMEARLLERGKTSGRTDDNIESIKKRFATHIKETTPVIQYFAGLGKVRVIDANVPVDEAYAATKRAVEPFICAEVVDTNQFLLDAIHAGDWSVYESFCAPDLTAIEPESHGQVVTGLGFHKFYFDVSAAGAKSGDAKPASKSAMAGINVRLVTPRVAVVAYTRLVQRATGGTGVASETRIWTFEKGVWVNVHFHRSVVV